MDDVGRTIKGRLKWYGATQHSGKVISKEETYNWIEKAVSINCSPPLPSSLRISDVELFQVADRERAKLISIEGKGFGFVEMSDSSEAKSIERIRVQRTYHES